MFGFTTGQQPSAQPNQAQPNQAPWANLPTAQQPWNAQQNAPWRLTPWQTQGMPAGQGFQAPGFEELPGLMNPNSYLPQGTSQDIPGFNPMVPGGNLQPQQPAPAPAPEKPTPQKMYTTPWGVTDTRERANVAAGIYNQLNPSSIYPTPGGGGMPKPRQFTPSVTYK